MNSQNIISTTEARTKLFTIIDEVSSPDTFYTLTDHGKAKAVIMSAEEFDSWVETLELTHLFPNLKNDIKKSREEFKKGKFVSLAELKNKK